MRWSDLRYHRSVIVRGDEVVGGTDRLIGGNGVGRVIVSNAELTARIAQLGAQITADYVTIRPCWSGS